MYNKTTNYLTIIIKSFIKNQFFNYIVNNSKTCNNLNSIVNSLCSS